MKGIVGVIADALGLLAIWAFAIYGLPLLVAIAQD